MLFRFDSVELQSIRNLFYTISTLAKEKPVPSHVQSEKSTQSSRWLVVLAAAGLAVLGLWYLSSGESAPTQSTRDSFEAQEENRGSAATRAEQRLRELRAAHEASGKSALSSGQRSGELVAPEGGRFQVPGQSSGASSGTKVKPKPGASAAGADSAESAEYEEPDPDDFPALKRMALEDPDPDRRLAAVTLLGASDDPQAIPVLAEVLKDQDEEVRLAAIQSLADMTGEVPVEVLGNAALNDPSPDNRYEALEALADLGGPAARPYLERALHDPDEDVASLAESLLELGHESEEEPANAPPPMVEQR